jgi:3-oxoadipate enol-lactonase
MPLAQINGNRLYFEDSGGSGPAIVFSHGGFLDHTMWEHQVAALSSDYRCVTWDERGHGMSECNGSFDYWDGAKDAIALLDELGIREAVFVGMSQGGWLTQRAALGSPERVRGIVLMSTSFRLLSAEELERYGQLAQGWQALGPVDEIAAGTLGAQFAGSDYDGSRYIGKWQSKPPGDWADVWRGVLDGHDDITERMGEIACPALFIHGTVDQVFPVDFAREMSEMVADSRGVTVIDGGPHCLALAESDEVNNALRGFMKEL